MAVITLRPKTHVRLEFPVPKKRRISYFVEADEPINTYIFDEEGLEEFATGLMPRPLAYAGYDRRKIHEQELSLPFASGDWYLVILNPSEKPAAVHYEVYRD